MILHLVRHYNCQTMYNQPMSAFHFYQPVTVRYSDLDPQWHVNNTRFLAYLEEARLGYILNLKLFDGVSFHDIRSIIADVHISYLAPIEYRDPVRVGIRTSHMGNKSMRFEYQIENPETGLVFARAETVNVAYDYHARKSIPIPDEWREKIAAFEEKPEFRFPPSQSEA